MTRSLRNWLASLFLLAAPGVSFGQNHIGQPHLAPVALEARCRVADGMLDSWRNFHVSGADPLHVAMLSLQPNRSTPISVMPRSAETVPAVPTTDERATDGPQSLVEFTGESPISHFQPSPDFCPFADFVQPRNISAKPSVLSRRVVVKDQVIDSPLAAHLHANARQRNAAEQKLAIQKLAKDLLVKIAADEPIDVNYLAVAKADVATIVSGGSSAGSSPMVVTLDEEYLAYDLTTSDLASKHPVTIRILNLPAPNYCMLPPHAVLPFDPMNGNIAENADDDGVFDLAVSSLHNQMDLCEYLPSDEYRTFLQDMAQPESARLPLDCWMDELVWRTSDMLRQDGPIASQLDANLLGQQLAKLTTVAFGGVVTYSQPAVPILAQPLAPQQPPGQRFAVPPGQRMSELAVAGSALINVAEELESLAAALRGWGSSINRVAAGRQPLVR